MKVAFVVGKFPALSETFILNQITGLIDRGHEVEVYAQRPVTTEPAHAEVDRYELITRTHYRPTPPQNISRRIWRASKIVASALFVRPDTLIQAFNVRRYSRHATSLRLVYALAPLVGQRRDYDIIHCHFGPYGILGSFFRDTGLINGKLVTTFHGADVSAAIERNGTRVYTDLFLSGDLFLPVSQHWKNRLIELGCPTEKIVVHRMGINCDEFAFEARRPEVDGTVRFISVCRLVEKKGIEYAIRAVAALANTGTKVAYDVVGDGPERARLEQLAAELGARTLVRFHGWQERRAVMALLATASAFVAPSVTSSSGEQEGVPVALMEAMAMGLPAVSTKHSGIPELIDDGVSGLLVDERDTRALQKALAYLVDNPGASAEIARAGRAKVERDFAIGKLNDQLIGLFESLIKDGDRPKYQVKDDYRVQKAS